MGPLAERRGTILISIVEQSSSLIQGPSCFVSPVSHIQPISAYTVFVWKLETPVRCRLTKSQRKSLNVDGGPMLCMHHRYLMELESKSQWVCFGWHLTDVILPEKASNALVGAIEIVLFPLKR
ncbi:hypothetical protein ASPBRDRAFT_37246 [Aspergillus brasiliensis CBS 101740]|uniref:Uncharacterized protein n=1 Tax=Aspergillus brasiliensis (strain CBS 101740 / IMI 381727 / IBT 21946) TaxID=767769 RepID=A0A1L9V2H5_ASPBC|nr:hypothetical protein ASPBRDRAFT_37246 [Aspergillus brasiliensis CBS 101740]